MRTFCMKAFTTALVAAAMLAPTPARADGPTVTILSPTGTIFVSGAGAVVPISLRVYHASGLASLTQFDVQVDGSSIIGGQVNPFTNAPTPNLCTASLLAVSASCTTNLNDTADVTVNWTVPSAPGTFTLFVRTRHMSTDGSDLEEVSVELLTVEYPAPPAIANAYINSQTTAIKKAFTSGVRGCVISQIAEEHAKYSTYGPKGGPYDIDAVQADVRTLSPLCGGPTF